MAGPLLLSLAAMLLRLRAEFRTAAASAIAAGGAGDGLSHLAGRSRGGSAAPSRAPSPDVPWAGRNPVRVALRASTRRAHSRTASPDVHRAGRNPGGVARRAGARRARTCSTERPCARGMVDQEHAAAELPRHQRM